MAAPAFATTGASMSYVMSNNFPSQSTSSYSSTYTGLIQRYMCVYNSTTRADIVDNGGIDGSFGSGTRSAVINYQKAKNFTQDGVFGNQSWPSLANVLSGDSTSGVVRYSYYSYLFVQSMPMIKVTGVISGNAQSTSYWYYGCYDGTTEGYKYLRYGIASATN